MQTSGLFITHSFTIPMHYGKDTRIICFGDVHRDSPNHADSKWQEDLDYFRKLPKDSTYFLGMGDYLDSTSTSERESWAIRSGSYLASFRAGESNYNIDACRMPSSLGHVELLIRFNRNRKGDENGGSEVETQIRCLA